ncbi:MAG: cell wall hydrolase [Clostridia bacterium]|nr:cell wall hydrolase [Clostridia bacterium]
MNLRKGLLLAAFLAVAILCFGVTVSASHPSVPVTVGDKTLTGYLIEEKTYVSLTEFARAMDRESRLISTSGGIHTVSARGIRVSAQLWNSYVEANGRCFYTETSCRLIDGALYVPIRPLAYIFNTDVLWDERTKSVTLRDRGGVCQSGDEVYWDGAVLWLSRIIYAESRGEPLLGKIAVGNVIMNRVKSPQYPNTIYSVIFDRKYGTQFTPVATGAIYNTPSDECIRAAKMVLEGTSVNGSVLFFMNPRIATSSWISKNRKYAFTIGNHAFYY